MVASAPEPVTFRFHDIGLDKIHSRLYYDKYHTPEMLLADVQRIVENSYYDGDPELFTKADAMLNQAKVMVDQACDAQFRLECQRMAAREKERVKQAKGKEKERRLNEANEKEQPSATTTADKPDAANPLKRTREGEDADSDASKRVRFGDGMSLDGSPIANKDGISRVVPGMESGPSSASLVMQAPSGSGFRVSYSAPTGAGDMMQVVNSNATVGSQSLASSSSSSFPAHAPLASTSSSVTEALALPSNSTSTLSSILSAPPRPSSPAPPAPSEPLPDFILPETLLAELSVIFRSSTEKLTIDELEQLRAACYDAIWRARKEWNKENLVREMMELSEEFVQEVEEAKGSED